MPEGTAKVNGKNLTVIGNTLWRNYPIDTYEASNGTNVMPAFLGNGLTAEALQTQIYSRSPFVNTVYYDPRVRYRPWATPTGRYPTAVFSQAYTNPNNQQTAPNRSTWVAHSPTPSSTVG